MDVFSLRENVIGDYGRYVRSFLKIRDPRIEQFVDQEMDRGALWPDPLIQLNPAFEPGPSLDELVAEGTLHDECRRIFADKDEKDGHVRAPLRFHKHQVDAFRAARRGEHYVLTTGTGSGKSLSHIVPIVDHVLRRGTGKGIQAIVVYPMNALANSPSRASTWPRRRAGFAIRTAPAPRKASTRRSAASRARVASSTSPSIPSSPTATSRSSTTPTPRVAPSLCLRKTP